MKPIAVQRSWEKNSRVGRSFWLLSRIGQRFGAFRKGRVKRTEPQRPLSFWGSFSPASKTAMGKWSSANPARSRLRCCEWSVVRYAAPGRLRRIPRGHHGRIRESPGRRQDPTGRSGGRPPGASRIEGKGYPRPIHACAWSVSIHSASDSAGASPQIARIAVGIGLGHGRDRRGENPIDHHGGPELMLRDEFEHGSSFRVYLPEIPLNM